MVEDGHQTRVFGMALECPESRLREKVRPAQIERVRPGTMQEQMRPSLPSPGDVDPQRTPERRTLPTR